MTQNIDGLHQLAGNRPEGVVEIHGTIHEAVCLRCGDRQPMRQVLERVRGRRGRSPVPRGGCGGILKSATISFGQRLVAEDLRRAQHAAETCDLLLAVGTTLGVYPAAGLVPLAGSLGGRRSSW